MDKGTLIFIAIIISWFIGTIDVVFGIGCIFLIIAYAFTESTKNDNDNPFL